MVLPCALGRSGISARKREGDGATPAGIHKLSQAYFRADKLMRPATGLPLRSLRRDDGWCDAIGDRNYNRPVRHPYPSSAERMWRKDALYDLVIVAGYNSRPRIQGRGSAIFVHMATGDLKPTEGCVALRRRDLLKIARLIGPTTRLVVL
jgi:L,D-peptidoglycan transpeptidase YkuD (ErfK/YbiS/YcfS/YnhG family)